MPKQAKRVPVSKRALIQRINRKLAPAFRQLKRCRSQRWRPDMGDYYVLDLDRNTLVRTHVDLEAVGRELNVLGEWETVADE